MPVLGLCGTVDWAVEPIAADETGGIAGTVSYGTTRNELDAAQAATENWQPGIPNVTVHLFAPVICGSDLVGHRPDVRRCWTARTAATRFSSRRSTCAQTASR